MPVDFDGALEAATVLAQRLSMLLSMANHPNPSKPEQCRSAFKQAYHGAQTLLSYGGEANLAAAVEAVNEISDAATFSDLSADSMHGAVLRSARYYLKHMDDDADTAARTMIGKPDITSAELDKIHRQLKKEHDRAIAIIPETVMQVSVSTASSDETAKPVKAKRSTLPNEAREKLVAALCQHHGFDGNSCSNYEPIGSNELCRLAEVGSTASGTRFFQGEFDGLQRYRVACANSADLIFRLKLLRGEVRPRDVPTYGRTPPGEGRDDD